MNATITHVERTEPKTIQVDFTGAEVQNAHSLLPWRRPWQPTRLVIDLLERDGLPGQVTLIGHTVDLPRRRVRRTFHTRRVWGRAPKWARRIVDEALARLARIEGAR